MQIQFKQMPVQTVKLSVECRAVWLGEAQESEGAQGLWSACSFAFAVGKHLAGDAVHGYRIALSPAQGGLLAATGAALRGEVPKQRDKGACPAHVLGMELGKGSEEPCSHTCSIVQVLNVWLSKNPMGFLFFCF